MNTVNEAIRLIVDKGEPNTATLLCVAIIDMLLLEIGTMPPADNVVNPEHIAGCVEAISTMGERCDEPDLVRLADLARQHEGQLLTVPKGETAKDKYLAAIAGIAVECIAMTAERLDLPPHKDWVN